jgi:hypothetical protein
MHTLVLSQGQGSIANLKDWSLVHTTPKLGPVPRPGLKKEQGWLDILSNRVKFHSLEILPGAKGRLCS